MAKYYLKSTTQWQGTTQKAELPEFSEEMYQDFDNGKLDSNIVDELKQQAIEQQGFEWWIEKVEDDED